MAQQMLRHCFVKALRLILVKQTLYTTNATKQWLAIVVVPERDRLFK
jgi:hypothetical protein